MKQRNTITLGAAFAALACLATVSAHAQLGGTFATNGHKGYAAPGGGGNLYVAGTAFPNLIEGMPYTLTNDFGFDVTAVDDFVTLVSDPTGGNLNLFVFDSDLLTKGGADSVPIANGDSVSGALSATVSDGGNPNPIPDFQLNWTVDLVKTSDGSFLGSQSFIIDVSANPPLLDTSSSTPEPGSIALLTGVGLAGSTVWLRRRRRK